jgi:CRISPR-associated protein Cmr2
MKNTDSSYKETRQLLEEELAARKLLHDFVPWIQQQEGVPKSSLDGARQSVLLPPAERPQRLAARFYIPSGEQLDAVGLVKRAGGKPGQFVPLTNIALASWLAHARKMADPALDRLIIACDELGIDKVRQDLSWTGAFPRDAQIFFPSRWAALLEELGRTDLDPRTWGQTHVEPVLRNKMMAEPLPYVACLVADGDRMGKTLRKLNREAHSRLAQALFEFVKDARDAIEKDRRGILIYAGGDDVLAFVCLPDAPACARALADRFAVHMKRALPDEQEPPTLSVGIGVGHLMDGMAELLSLGREASKRAKGHGERSRNSLAVIVKPRSGGGVAWRGRWDEDPDPAQRLEKDMTLLDGKLSHRKLFQVKRLLQRMPEPEELQQSERPWSEWESWRNALLHDTRGILRRTEQEGDTEENLSPEQVGLDLSAGDYPAVHAALSRWVARVMVARTLRSADPARTKKEST